MRVIRNGHLMVGIDERLGGEITRIQHHNHDLLASYDWISPVGVARSTTYGDERLDWLSDYRGGWQLLAPNAGAACEIDGVPLPFHGEWSRTQVTVTECAPDRIIMMAGTRLPLTVEREVSVETHPDRVLVRTTVANPSNQLAHFIWVEHPAFAAGNGDRIDFPDAQVFAADGADLGQWPSRSTAPRLDAVDATRSCESVHFLVGLSEGWAGIRRQEYGVALAWDVEDFPYAWLWHEIASPGFPFYGRASLLAIEPASSWPGNGLSGAMARGQAMQLQPNERRSTTVAMIPFETDGRVLTGASITGRLEFTPS